MPMAIVRRKIAAVSSMPHLDDGCRRVIAQSTTTGATIRLAAASARYQVGQVDTKVDTKFDAQVDKASAVMAAEPEKVASSARITPATATIELIIPVGAKQISANFAMPVDVRKVLTPADHRSTSNAPANAAINVPIAVTPGANRERVTSAPAQMIPIRPQAISGGRAAEREPAQARSAATTVSPSD